MGLVLKDQSAHVSLTELVARQGSRQLLDSRRAADAGQSWWGGAPLAPPTNF